MGPGNKKTNFIKFKIICLIQEIVKVKWKKVINALC